MRTEDITCQSTQPLLSLRKEQLGTSDKGVILIRKIILNAIEAVQDKRTPKGLVSPERADQLVKIDSFTGVCAKGLS